jgi:excisionase family DNA binding protein
MSEELTPGLLTPKEMAAMMQVHSQTVRKWEKRGYIRAVRTPGGHRRYYLEDAEAILRGEWLAIRARAGKDLENRGSA